MAKFDFTLYKVAEKQVEKARERGDKPIQGAIIGVCVLTVVVFFYDAPALGGAFSTIAALMPIWFPIYLGKILFISFVDYRRLLVWFAMDNVLLEITLPPEIEKSPSAMEVFLTTFSSTSGENTWFDRIFLGKNRAVWSLEIASNEGRISYYIYSRRALRNLVEARLYGQFPEARITEVDDYVDKVPFNLEEYDLYGLEYAKADIQPLPIKTYLAYELDKNLGKPELQTDPLTYILEFLSNAGKDEYIWLQFIVRGRKKDEWKGLYSNKDSYLDAAKDAIAVKYKEAVARGKILEKDLKLQYAPLPIVTDSEKKRVENVERSLTKSVLECGLRSIYIGKKEVFQGVNIPTLIGVFSGPFRGIKTTEYNGLIPASRGLIDYNYPWQDFRDIKQNKEKKKILKSFKHREYFFVPMNQVPVCMTTEELATLWRFPSSVVKTPGLQRVPSRTGEAPPNLPL